MAGYGSADDHIGATQNHIDDSLALQRLSAQANTNATGECLECGEDIPPARLLAIPNANHCVGCQQDLDSHGKRHAQFTVKNHYQP
jgi:phage/conjugal plasmid C-4 type zinc finger TraR family protein